MENDLTEIKNDLKLINGNQNTNKRNENPNDLNDLNLFGSKLTNENVLISLDWFLNKTNDLNDLSNNKSDTFINNLALNKDKNDELIEKILNKF